MTVYALNTLIIEKSVISNYMMSHLAIRLWKTVLVLIVFTCAVCNWICEYRYWNGISESACFSQTCPSVFSRSHSRILQSQVKPRNSNTITQWVCRVVAIFLTNFKRQGIDKTRCYKVTLRDSSSPTPSFPPFVWNPFQYLCFVKRQLEESLSYRVLTGHGFEDGIMTRKRKGGFAF